MNQYKSVTLLETIPTKMNIQTQKIELVKMILNTNDKSLLEIIKNIFTRQSVDLWDELDEEVKADVEEAIRQLDKGEGIPHERVMKKYKKWLQK